MVSKTALPAGRIVVDASLLVGIVEGYPEALPFIPVLSRSITTSVNFGETLYKLEQLSGLNPQDVERALFGLGLEVEPFGLAAARYFNKLKSIDAASRKAQLAAKVAPSKVKSLSLADMVCLSHGLDTKLPILTGDKHWCTLHKHGLTVPVFDYRNPATTP